MKTQLNYGEKRDYPKRDIFVNGTYSGSTTWAKTNKEAKERYIAAGNSGKQNITVRKA